MLTDHDSYPGLGDDTVHSPLVCYRYLSVRLIANVALALLRGSRLHRLERARGCRGRPADRPRVCRLHRVAAARHPQRPSEREDVLEERCASLHRHPCERRARPVRGEVLELRLMFIMIDVFGDDAMCCFERGLQYVGVFLWFRL